MPQNALCFLDMLSPSVLETGRNPLHLMILEHCDTQTHWGEPKEIEGEGLLCGEGVVLCYIRNPFNSSWHFAQDETKRLGAKFKTFSNFSSLGQASGNNVGTQRQKLPQMLPLLLHLFHGAARHPASTTHFMFFFLPPVCRFGFWVGVAYANQKRSSAQLQNAEQ